MRDESVGRIRWGEAFVDSLRLRRRELVLTVRAVQDFVRGFRALRGADPCVTVFGSARFREGHAYYGLARRVGHGLAGHGFTVMTGGGPGLMEAANRGARDAGGRSVGCNIILASDERPNAYLDRRVSVRYFFVRKVLLFNYSHGFVVLPGGFGTMDELFEALTLVQTQKMTCPVVLMGTAYWTGLLDLFRRMVAEGTVEPGELRTWLVTDDVDRAMAVFENAALTTRPEDGIDAAALQAGAARSPRGRRLTSHSASKGGSPARSGRPGPERAGGSPEPGMR